VPRKYGIYFVQGFGPVSGIKRLLGHVLRRGDLENANLLKITREESVKHADILAPLLRDLIDTASEIIVELKPGLHEVMWRYLYLPVIPLYIERPALREAFKLSRRLISHVKPSLKQRLLPAYMLEKGGVSLGTNVINLSNSHVLVSLYGSFPDGRAVEPGNIPSRKELLRLVGGLKKKDYILPDEGDSPLPVLGAVILKPVIDTTGKFDSLISSWIRKNYDVLLHLSKEVAEEHGSSTLAWDAFFYLIHLLVSLVTYGLVKEKVLQFPKPGIGILELLPVLHSRPR